MKLFIDTKFFDILYLHQVTNIEHSHLIIDNIIMSKVTYFQTQFSNFTFKMNLEGHGDFTINSAALLSHERLMDSC